MTVKYTIRPAAFVGMVDQDYRQSIYDMLSYYVAEVHHQEKEVAQFRRQEIMDIIRCLDLAPNRSAIESSLRIIIDKMSVAKPWFILRYFKRNSRLKSLLITLLDNHHLSSMLNQKDEEIAELRQQLVTQQQAMIEAHRNDIRHMQENCDTATQRLRTEIEILIGETQSLRSENQEIKRYLSEHVRSLQPDKIAHKP
ncbi:MAG: hypothetical protein CMF46_00925 [Legionellales bacterium]|nr:hypothetical protein [Legionellales bacterium]|tara:strand:+ start:404 stop:994 length:591 start_codon:yes stop_codon:yes gene_type:complete